MKKFFNYFFMHYIAPVIGLLIILPVFIEHFYFKGNIYFLNYIKLLSIVATLFFLFISLLALFTTSVKSSQYNNKEIDELRRSVKNTFIGKYVYRPIFWVAYFGLFLTGHFWLGSMYVFIIITGRVITRKNKKIIAEYDAGIGYESTNNKPVEAEFIEIE